MRNLLGEQLGGNSSCSLGRNNQSYRLPRILLILSGRARRERAPSPAVFTGRAGNHGFRRFGTRSWGIG